jgi:hypothetical protein
LGAKLNVVHTLDSRLVSDQLWGKRKCPDNIKIDSYYIDVLEGRGYWCLFVWWMWTSGFLITEIRLFVAYQVIIKLANSVCPL